MIKIATMQKIKEIANPIKIYGKLLVTSASKREPIVSGRIKTTPIRTRLSDMIALRLILLLPNVGVMATPLARASIDCKVKVEIT